MHNLIDKGDVFVRILSHPLISAVATKLLGSDFQVGSYATNTVFAGGSGQGPHYDYPYWGLKDRPAAWPAKPRTKDNAHLLNMQATVMVDDFTPENGATGVWPGSQVTTVNAVSYSKTLKVKKSQGFINT